MDAQEILSQARDTMTVRRVYGEPIERNGTTVVPVANVMGGGGGGEGPVPMPAEGERAEGAIPPTGGGAGFGVRATPAGVYVIKDGNVRWMPAVDATRIAIMGQVVALMFLFVIRTAIKRRSPA